MGPRFIQHLINQWNARPVHGHNNDCGEYDGKDDKDGNQEVEVHVEGGEGPHKLHVTVLLMRNKISQSRNTRYVE